MPGFVVRGTAPVTARMIPCARCKSGLVSTAAPVRLCARCKADRSAEASARDAVPPPDDPSPDS